MKTIKTTYKELESTNSREVEAMRQVEGRRTPYLEMNEIRTTSEKVEAIRTKSKEVETIVEAMRTKSKEVKS